MSNKAHLSFATLKHILVQSQGWKAFMACFNSSVSGDSGWLAKYVEGGLCRVKWVTSVAIILWLNQGVQLNKFKVNDYISAAETFSKSDTDSAASLLIWGSVSIGILGTLLGLFLSRKKLTLTHAQWLLGFVLLSIWTSQALLLGFSHLKIRSGHFFRFATAGFLLDHAFATHDNHAADRIQPGRGLNFVGTKKLSTIKLNSWRQSSSSIRRETWPL